MEAVSDLLQPILVLQSNILPWHWFIVAVALGSLEMLFTGGVLMGGAIAAILVGAASFAAQKFPDALPPDLGFGLGTQLVTFLFLMGVFAAAMRIGRRKAADMVARAAAPPLPPAPEAVAAPTPTAAPPAPPIAPAAAASAPSPAPTAGVIAPVLTPVPKPLMPTPAVAPTAPSQAPAPPPAPVPARPATPAPEKMSPQPPVQPMVAPPPPPPANPGPRPAAPAKSPPPRPTQMGPMRVSGPTAVTTPPAPTKASSPSAKAPAPAPPPAAAKPGSDPQELVGREYTLWKPLAAGKGTLRIGGVDWALSGPDVAAGARVRVTGVQGSTLTVTPVP